MEKSTYSPHGFDLYQITPNEWILHKKGSHLYPGTFREVCLLAVKKFSFSMEEIEIAVDYIGKLDHNAAHFGGNRTFIYSFQKDFNDVERAS